MVALTVLLQNVIEGEDLRLGFPVSGQIAEGVEAVWHRVAAEGRWIYDVTADIASTVGAFDFELRLDLYPLDRSGTLPCVTNLPSSAKCIEWLTTDGADYWVRIADFPAGVDHYRLALSRTEVRRLHRGDPQSREVTETEPSHWYAIDGRAGRIYEWTATPDTLHLPYLELYTEGMTRLLPRYDAEEVVISTSMSWAPARDGTLLLNVSGSSGWDFGTYHVNMSDREAGEGESPARPHRRALGPDGSAAIEGEVTRPHLEQWFQVEFAGGCAYRIVATGDTLRDVELDLCTGTGEQLRGVADHDEDDEYPDARIEWQPEVGGSFLLCVRSGDSRWGGTFRLVISETSP